MIKTPQMERAVKAIRCDESISVEPINVITEVWRYKWGKDEILIYQEGTNGPQLVISFDDESHFYEIRVEEWINPFKKNKRTWYIVEEDFLYICEHFPTDLFMLVEILMKFLVSTSDLFRVAITLRKKGFMPASIYPTLKSLSEEEMIRLLKAEDAEQAYIKLYKITE